MSHMSEACCVCFAVSYCELNSRKQEQRHLSFLVCRLVLLIMAGISKALEFPAEVVFQRVTNSAEVSVWGLQAFVELTQQPFM